LLSIIGEEGIRGLYRGYTISIVTIPMFHTIYFPIYEKVKQKFREEKGWDPHSFKLFSVSAGISGFTCNVLTNPFWVPHHSAY